MEQACGLTPGPLGSGNPSLITHVSIHCLFLSGHCSRAELVKWWPKPHVLPIRSSLPLEEELKQSSPHFHAINRNSYGSMGEMSLLAEMSPSGPPVPQLYLNSMCSSGVGCLIPTALLALRIHLCFLSSRSEISVPGLSVSRDRDSIGRSP